jgi:hypothetical protein
LADGTSFSSSSDPIDISRNFDWPIEKPGPFIGSAKFVFADEFMSFGSAVDCSGRAPDGDPFSVEDVSLEPTAEGRADDGFLGYRLWTSGS